MNHKTIDLKRVLLSVQFAVLALAATALQAQEKPAAATPASPDKEEEVLKLSPFTVTTSESDQYYAPRQSAIGTIVAKDRDQIPFGTSVVTEDMLRDMLLDNPMEYASVLPGVSQGDGAPIDRDGGTSGNALQYRVRGFVVEPLYNGFQTGGTNNSPDSIGRIEVMKTPNSILYGQSSAGGTINFVPKAPQYRVHGDVAAGIWSNNGNRVYVDLGGPIGTGNQQAVRFGAGSQYFEREQEFFKSRQSSAYGAYNMKITDKISLELTGEYVDFKYTPSRTGAFVSLGSGPARVVDPYNRLRKDRNFSYHGPHQYTARDTFLSSAYLNFDLAKSLTLRVGGFYGYQEYTHQLLTGTYGLGTAETVNGVYGNGKGNKASTDLKFDLLHQAKFMGLSVDTLLGYEAHTDNAFNEEYQTLPAVTPIIVTIPFTRRLMASDFPEPPSDDKFTNRTVDNNNKLNWSNLRFTQFLTTENQRTTAMWGVAYGEGETIAIDNRAGGKSRGEGSDTTYTVGGTHVIMTNDDVKVTLFGNYSTSFLIQPGNQQSPTQFLGFQTVAELTAYTLSVQPNPVEPQTGSGFETGVRLQFPKQKLHMELAYFDQSRENISRNFFVRRSLAANSTDEQVIATFQLASGEEQVSGVDISLDWSPTAKLTLTAGAAFMNGKVVANPEVPQEVGLGLISMPETQIEFWGLYSFGSNQSTGFKVGLGASYNTATNVFPTIGDRFRFSDDYTMARALLRYDYKLGRYNHTVSLNIDNLLDQEFTYEADQLSEPRIYKFTYNIGW